MDTKKDFMMVFLMTMIPVTMMLLFVFMLQVWISPFEHCMTETSEMINDTIYFRCCNTVGVEDGEFVTECDIGEGKYNPLKKRLTDFVLLNGLFAILVSLLIIILMVVGFL